MVVFLKLLNYKQAIGLFCTIIGRIKNNVKPYQKKTKKFSWFKTRLFERILNPSNFSAVSATFSTFPISLGLKNIQL